MVILARLFIRQSEGAVVCQGCIAVKTIVDSTSLDEEEQNKACQRLERDTVDIKMVQRRRVYQWAKGSETARL